MKKYLKTNWIILSFIAFTVLGEVGHLAFEGIPFEAGRDLDTPMYFLINQWGLITFWPAFVFFKIIDKERIASKCMAFGLVMWNVKELADEVAYIAGVNENVFEINGSFWGQIGFMVVVVAFSAYGYFRWKY